MDELATFNRERWNALVEAGVEYGRPFLDMTEERARAWVDNEGLLGDVTGKRVLCLANGGGQQSACFGLLGAQVAVLDLSDAQLEKDREVAAHYGLQIETVQGDMRDLFRFEAASFDLVAHWYSINFVPDVRQVFTQVAQVIKPGGIYKMQCSNPHRFGMDDVQPWNGRGFEMIHKYGDGEAMFRDVHWDVDDAEGKTQRVVGPREFVHSWSTLMNGLADQGFVITHFKEYIKRDENPEPGGWAHLTQVMPPFISFWTVYRPDVFATVNKVANEGPNPVDLGW
jgi:ubiquinone/menaquinone biosynthesis C-methylase UbiE